ncbi:MAG: MarR family transcriptional regulator [Coriobacteriales bacterium]|nr:MarR family transcriptional regulator [Coriobacteriales bacterium]
MRRKRVLREIAEIEYKRAVKHVEGTGVLSQVELAETLGITQPSVSYAVRRARDVDDPRDGFAGATPFEICQRYSVGELQRKQLLDQLVKWEYAEPTQTDGYDALISDAPGSFRDVERAAIMGLIENDIYETVLGHLSKRS